MRLDEESRDPRPGGRFEPRLFDRLFGLPLTAKEAIYGASATRHPRDDRTQLADAISQTGDGWAQASGCRLQIVAEPRELDQPVRVAAEPGKRSQRRSWV